MEQLSAGALLIQVEKAGQGVVVGQAAFAPFVAPSVGPGMAAEHNPKRAERNQGFMSLSCYRARRYHLRCGLMTFRAIMRARRRAMQLT